MTSTTLIASGRALFELPAGRFDQITREPLTRTSTGFTEARIKETQDERQSTRHANAG